MSHPFNRCALALALYCGCISITNAEADDSAAEQVPDQGTASQFVDAEQFVHGFLYDAMLNVWAEDRRAWNQLLHVHACGGEQQAQKLTHSYEKAQPLFSQTMLALADAQEMFGENQQQAILSDVAQLAYRLFSASYAHGYARQVQRAEDLSPGIQEELCGAPDPMRPEGPVNYPSSASWQLSLDGGETSELVAEQGQISLHAENGYSAFKGILQQQYDKFDALVFSHAYQNTTAYDQLFFEVNRYENVQAYHASVNNVAVDAEGLETPHADFAYLVLASGYHWGTLSVLAMLEEEYPRLHKKAKDKATSHIESVTRQLSAQQEDTASNDSIGH